MQRVHRRGSQLLSEFCKVPGETLIRHLKFRGPYCKSVPEATRIIKSRTGHFHENSDSDEEDDFDHVEWAGVHFVCGFL